MAQNTQHNSATVRITDARISHEEESARRQRQYLMLMGIRVVCFFAAFFTHGWIRWLFVAGMVLIPWFAVIIANEVRTRRDDASEHMLHAPPTEALGSSAEPVPTDEDTDVVMGEVVVDLEGQATSHAQEDPYGKEVPGEN